MTRLTEEELLELQAASDAGEIVGVTEASKRVRWPWPKMEVGDQVFVPDHMLTKAKAAIVMYSRRSGKKFVSMPAPGGRKYTRLGT